MDSFQVTDDVTDDNSDDLQVQRRQLFHHPLYEAVQTADSLRLFMREHVFAVWDFMSLLKRLQQLVTCCELPWVPAVDPSLCRFINEIVLGEECDEDGQEGYASHFELYLNAMDDVGADAQPIRDFVSKLRSGVFWESALASVSILPTTRLFVESTMRLTLTGKPHQVAAAFFYGREDIIPEMFQRLVQSLPQQGVRVGRLVHYLQRHIELDGNEHGPLARKLVDSLCAHDPIRQHEARQAAQSAIRARIQLWDGVLKGIESDHLAF